MSRLRLYATVMAGLVIGVLLAAGGTAAAPLPPTIDSGPLKLTNQADATFTFSDTDPTVTSFACLRDTETFSPCVSPPGVSYHNLAAGPHTFEVKAIDAMAGETVTTYTWTIDATPPPAPTITAKPPDPSNDGSPTFTFSDGDSTATFECRLDAAAFAACTSPKAYAGQTDGSHTFRVRAVDAANNLSDATVYTWTIDTTPPPAPSITAKPSDPSNDKSPTLGFSDSEGGVTFACKLDSGAFAGCTSPKGYTGQTDGSHTFTVRASDAAGNTSSTSYTWTINTTPPPAPTITAKPPDPSNDKSPTFGFSDGDSTATFQCRLDAGTFAGCTSPKGYTGQTDGSHTFRVRAVDAANNLSDATVYTWTIDTTPPPAPTITAKPPDPSNDGSPTFTFSDGDSTATFECRLDAAAFAACQSPKAYAGQTDGSHTFRVRAVDAANNLSDATVYTWTIDTTPPPAPTITAKPPDPSKNGSPTFTFSDSESTATFQCRLDGGDFSICASPKTYSGVAVGSHAFDVRAKDPAGNTGASAGYTWTVAQGADTTSPQDVAGLKRKVGYRTLKLVWSRPPDPDFDHVRVLIATARKGAKAVPQKVVYTGSGTRYTNKRFKSGQYYRYRILSYDHAGNQSRGVDVVVPPSVLLRAPRDGGVVHAPPRLAWDKVAKATFYNVQLYRSGSKILSAWPRAATIRVKGHWSYSGHHFRLKKGQYQWFVWPGFGPRSKGRYGRLLGQATFTVG